MKKHRGMRPHDIAVLLKIAALGNKRWHMKDLAFELEISPSEISESIHRSVFSGLIAQDKKRLMKMALIEFLSHGLRYVFPQQPGSLVRGMPTAHSAPPLNKIIASEEPFVWPYAQGKVRGQSIEPLHPRIPHACQKDTEFYKLMALCDSIRAGKNRERNIAIKELERQIN